MDKLIEFIQRILEWVVELLLWVPRKIYELITQGLGDFFHAIPVPTFIQNLGSLTASIDPGIAYFGAPLQIGACLGIIVGAYIIRFLIRRIPLIG